MATEAFEDIAETFEFLEDWEDRYRHVIDMGKAMEPLPESQRVPATKVEGCASQVWLVPAIEDGRVSFRGDSDAMIVRGLIAIVMTLLSGRAPEDIVKIDAREHLSRLGLHEHLTPQRSNGLTAMVTRIQSDAAQAIS